MKALSLFSNIGVAEAYLESIGIDVVVANELIPKRAQLYSKIYPNTNMICGDITSGEVFQKIINESASKSVDIIIATPPCQGMSTAGQQNENDIRNLLIMPVVEAVKKLKPRYAFIENVPQIYNTKIRIGTQEYLIPDYVKDKLSGDYEVVFSIIDTKMYSVPQSRERAIMLLSRKDCPLWQVPPKDTTIVTMRDAIGSIPSIDPYIEDVSETELLKIFPEYYEKEKRALDISPWNVPPRHKLRQVVAMQHTPTGATAFDNPIYFPKKKDGSPVRGYHNTYKRQNWDTPAYTVTMDNRKISSQNNVHPGRLLEVLPDGEKIYSDARTLTLYEIMKIMSLPDNWPVPKNTSEAFLRRIIGEGIPPLFVKKVFEELMRVNNEKT